ncbi:MAG TPA: BON domain-containing protein [Vicinamibacterales bacterium]|nr:BON domain-containing protein [Vicinamibacterales bacterium]
MRKISLFVLAGAIAAAAACAASDPGITTAVKSKFAADDTVKASQIDVDTKDGVVTLSGAVESQMVKDRAVQLARETGGVTSVDDRLTVNPALAGATAPYEPEPGTADRAQGTAGSASDKAGDAADKIGEAVRATGAAASQAVKDATPVVADAGITAAVKTRLLADPDVAGLRINVDTKDKVVTLTGTVKAASQVTEAEKIARETPGVVRVVNNLKVGA